MNKPNLEHVGFVIDPSFKISEPIVAVIGDNTFNLGVGMLAAVAAEDADAAVRCLRENGVEAYVCGEVERGEGGVELW